MAQPTAPHTAEEAAAFRAALNAANMSALWEDEGRTGGPRHGPEPALLWRWEQVEPLITQAVRATSIETADRRVLSLRKPASNSVLTGLTTNLVAALQILMPGEVAPAHRHTMGALRFVMEGEGAETLVDGKSCPMAPGDMILTPGWTWHEHVHKGSTRMVWFDGLDVPIHSHLETIRFEPGPARNMPVQLPDAAFAASGLVPQASFDRRSYSPLYRYPWDTAKAALAETPRAEDGSRTLRYTNPLNGGPAMDLIDCFLVGLDPNKPTAQTRSTATAICVVAEGSGSSRVGERDLAWGRNSIFTVPHGNWVSHRADTDAIIFMMTDRDLMQRLGVLRDEVRH
ncbi:MAG TPA: cupin domain-containing protein [Stellaceae bacterium]|nr:cupin domain-containing protein [Stellaceae bacterium]